jgi:ketosteroid isomerase-like protein
MKRALIALGALLSVCSSADAAPANPLVEAGPFIDRANADWGKAIVAGHVEAIVEPYSDDGVFILPDGKAVLGKPAIRQMYSGRPKRAQILEASATSDGRVAAGPDDVYEWGSASATLKTDKGAEHRNLGRFLTVWHRQGDKWVIIRNLAF